MNRSAGQPSITAIVHLGAAAGLPESLRRQLDFVEEIIECREPWPLPRAAAELPPPVHLPPRGEWSLRLRAEERLSLELRDEMLDALARSAGTVAGFSMLITAYRYGKYLRHGGARRREVRLWRTAPSPGAAAIRNLEHLLVDLGERRISDTLQRLSQMTPALSPAGDAREPITTFQLLSEPLALFSGAYLRRQAWRDGVPGLLHAAFLALDRALKLIQDWEGKSP